MVLLVAFMEPDTPVAAKMYSKTLTIAQNKRFADHSIYSQDLAMSDFRLFIRDNVWLRKQQAENNKELKTDMNNSNVKIFKYLQ